MSGAFWGALVGTGAALIWWSFWPREESARRETPTLAARLHDLLARAGYAGASITWVVLPSLGCALVAGIAVLAFTQVAPVALIFALMGAVVPVAWLRARARRRQHQLREVWPDVVDHIASAVRAGLALPESLSQLAIRGPDELRPAFQAFAADYRVSGRFADCLDRLKERLGDPVGDRLVESLRIAREVGGTDLGRLLRTLSTFLREDARVRAELEARQSWTVNAARLALVAPWVVLLMLTTQGDAIHAYREPGGAVILTAGAIITFVAFKIMLRIGRLPVETRVLR